MSDAEPTRDRDRIMQWAEARNARPAVVSDTKSNGIPGALLRFDFGKPTDSLDEISWDEFFSLMEDNALAVLLQEKTKTGKTSRFAKFVDAKENGVTEPPKQPAKPKAAAKKTSAAKQSSATTSGAAKGQSTAKAAAAKTPAKDKAPAKAPAEAKAPAQAKATATKSPVKAKAGSAKVGEAKPAAAKAAPKAKAPVKPRAPRKPKTGGDA